MHQFPTDPVVRAQWVRFVQKHRVDFGEPVNKYASLCSAHFEESCFTRNRSILEGMAAKSTRKATNTCRTCQQPMRGHSKAKCQQNAGY